MTFMRTRSGMANLNVFHRRDLIVYVEGRVEEGGTGEPPDAKFYNGIFAALRPHLRVKIKCVGNKSAVRDYLTKIEDGGIQGSLVAVDRDTSGIDFTNVDSEFQIVTFGYSWENDFWNPRLILAVTETLSAGTIDARWESWILEAMSNGEKRLKFICALDIAGRPCGCSPLLPKNKLGVNIACNLKSAFPITRAEVSRFARRFKGSAARNCHVCRNIFWSAMKRDPSSVIQGHIWERFVCHLICHYAKTYLRISAIEHKLLRQIGLSIFLRNAEELVTAEELGYYRSELDRCLI